MLNGTIFGCNFVLGGRRFCACPGRKQNRNRQLVPAWASSRAPGSISHHAQQAAVQKGRPNVYTYIRILIHFSLALSLTLSLALSLSLYIYIYIYICMLDGWGCPRHSAAFARAAREKSPDILLYVYVCVYIYIYICACVLKGVYIYIHTDTHLSLSLSRSLFLYIYIYIYVYVRPGQSVFRLTDYDCYYE